MTLTQQSQSYKYNKGSCFHPIESTKIQKQISHNVALLLADSNNLYSANPVIFVQVTMNNFQAIARYSRYLSSYLNKSWQFWNVFLIFRLQKRKRIPTLIPGFSSSEKATAQVKHNNLKT
jgi:hypothetical protein